MVVVPSVLPVAIPVEPMVAFVLLASQVPPPASVRLVFNPTHTVSAPDMVLGNGFMVTTAVVIQPVAVSA